ncbi:hypothetical protein ACFYOY_35995 [Streptomyces sp. NPDC007875]|uniref:hypothetical protein n=1 Tax=Streptomyces sp. NPDC007875 TaxID=3364783 RepID=UPI0036C7425F
MLAGAQHTEAMTYRACVTSDEEYTRRGIERGQDLVMMDAESEEFTSVTLADLMAKADAMKLIPGCPPLARTPDPARPLPHLHRRHALGHRRRIRRGPPVIDYAADLAAAAKYTAKFAKRRAKSRIKRPLRKAKKKALNLAFTPVAAALHGTWALQAGGAPETPAKPAKKSGSRGRKGQSGMKIPSVVKYREAYGMPAPQKGLVCEDTGRITAPGVSIACTECPGPAAVAMAAAERKAVRVRSASNSGSRLGPR